jgi:hypothetical protein
MLSLLIHAALGALTIWIFFRANDSLYAKDWPGSSIGVLEGLYHALAIGSPGTHLAAQERQVRWNEVRG